jgi:serine/threonine protein phosphatase PrpC
LTDGRIDLPLPPPPPVWGDREPPWLPETLGRRAKAAEAPWKLDPDPRFADTVLDEGRVGDIAAMACAVRGSKHRYEGTARQDAAIACGAAGSWALAAVADGVGSVPDSHKASALAVRVFAAVMAKRLAQPGNEDPKASGRAVFKEVNKQLLELGGPKTTLTVAAVAAHAGPDGGYPFWIASIGDSPAYAIRGGGLEPLLKTERDDEFATTTAAMPTADLKTQYDPDQEGTLRPGEAIMLVSDGIGDLMIAEESEEFFAQRWRGAPTATEFMRHVQVRRRSFDDDRSAAVLWALPGPAPATPPRLLAEAVTRSADTSPGDAELTAARVQDLEVRAAVRRGNLAAVSARPRRAHLKLAYLHEQLVAVAAAPRPGSDAPYDAERWTATMLRTIEKWLPGPDMEEWVKGLWQGAFYSAASDLDLDGLASAVLAACPDHEGRIHYTIGVQGPISAAMSGSGIHRDLDEVAAKTVPFNGAVGGPLVVHTGEVEPDQSLLLASGIDPAALARPRRPGPLEVFGLLEDTGGDDDQLALALWGEPR